MSHPPTHTPRRPTHTLHSLFPAPPHRNLFPIPRYNAHTITEPMTAKYGKVKVRSAQRPLRML